MQDKNLEKENTQVEAENNSETYDNSITIKWTVVEDENSIDIHYQIEENILNEKDIVYLFTAIIRFAAKHKISLSDILDEISTNLEEVFGCEQVVEETIIKNKDALPVFIKAILQAKEEEKNGED